MSATPAAGTPPAISVLLVTRDGMATLAAVLDALRAQRSTQPFEIVAVDSGSRDGSVELLRRRADVLVEIPPATFDHGATRNLGVARCRGDLVVLLVQDAVPLGHDWLETLVAPLRADPGLAGTYARQVARPEASALTRYHLGLWAAAAAEPREQALTSPAELAALSPAERHLRCAFDNVCSCVRRSVWQAIPFRPTPIAEDMEWGREVLLAGWRLRYTPEAAVLHSHERSARYELRRTRDAHARLAGLFDLRTIPTLPHLVRACAVTLRTHWRIASWRELPRALALAVVWPLGQYLGGRRRARGAPGTPASAARLRGTAQFP